MAFPRSAALVVDRMGVCALRKSAVPIQASHNGVVHAVAKHVPSVALVIQDHSP